MATLSVTGKTRLPMRALRSEDLARVASLASPCVIANSRSGLGPFSPQSGRGSRFWRCLTT